ncbi:MAG: hypothetical protein UX56_C0039G0004 [Candidatus Azambacteria bacterium GW2011_GWD2_46_48]|uniref:Uncharacterized protein n=1 Tax=Candidatus Azambacteria bacterium GW2011_GWD2_46_48 TaxID=1618623 RepID=A0A0G1Q580_9BACT|nr:MAG: hypothetical protein UX56_C0039G0004 [Candidatus Azambacteria bacterium GW2011_GWD2_46_48]
MGKRSFPKAEILKPRGFNEEQSDNGFESLSPSSEH